MGLEYQENTKNTIYLLYLSAITFGGGGNEAPFFIDGGGYNVEVTQMGNNQDNIEILALPVYDYNYDW